jgi:hypothetical protein
MLLGYVLARKRRLDLGTVRAVAERRPPARSGVKKRRGANRQVLDLGKEEFYPAFGTKSAPREPFKFELFFNL